MPNEPASRSPRNLTDLPAELVAELYLCALSPSFPHTCKYIYTVIKSLPSSVHARYIFGRHPPEVFSPYSKTKPTSITGLSLTRALGYPICDIHVLESMRRITLRTNIARINVTTDVFELPKRLFRSLGNSGKPLDANSEPLPLLQYLWERRSDVDFVKPAPNSHKGYPLVRAVHARFTPLVRFLLDHGADPGERDCMAVKVAIGNKDLTMVKMLIEFGPEPEARGKKRRREDRVVVTPPLLDLAVRCDARDIVKYFMEEKRCIPHMRTLKAIQP